MRLLDVFEAPDYVPLERGEALPQYHEDGDRYSWRNAWMWHWRFWYFLQNECRFHPESTAMHDESSMLLMGGEL